MNCRTARQHLLTARRVRTRDAELDAHLDACPDCAAVSAAVRLLDDSTVALPVPRPPRSLRAALLAEFDPRLAPPPTLPPVVPRVSPSERTPMPTAALVLPAEVDPTPPALVTPFRRRWSHRTGLVAGLAASVVGALVGGTVLYRAARDRGPVAAVVAAGPADPLVAKLVDRNVALATAETPARRLDNLLQLAGHLHAETRAVAQVADGEEMSALAGMYERVIRDGVVAQARELAGVDKAALRRVAGELSAASEQMEQYVHTVKPSSVGPVREMSRAARAGDAAVRSILREEAL